MRRYELTDEQYALLAPLFASANKLGRPQVDHRQILNGLFWRLSSGAAWRDLPARYGAWQTIYSRYTQWRRDGTWDQIVKLLQVSLDDHGKINWNEWNSQGFSGRVFSADELESNGAVAAGPGGRPLTSEATAIASQRRSGLQTA